MEGKKKTGAKRGSPGAKPPEGKRFTSDNQPSPEAKSQGWTRRKLLRDLLNGTVKGKTKNLDRWADAIAMYFGIDRSEVTYEMILHYTQFTKAIKKGDTSAYSAVLDRAFGKPKGEDEDKPVAPPDQRQTAAIDLGNGIKIQIG